jgi:hypothetical protein
LVPKLRVDQWLRDRVTRAAQSGRVVIIPDRYLRIERWHGTGWTELDPLTGAGGYLIVGVMTYMREGEAGNTSISLGPEHVSVGGHAAQPMDMEWAREKFGDFGNKLREGLENSTIEKLEKVGALWVAMLIPAPGGLKLFMQLGKKGAITFMGLSVGLLVYLLPPVLTSFYIMIVEPYGEIYLIGPNGEIIVIDVEYG